MSKVTLRIGGLRTVMHGVRPDVAEQAMAGIGAELESRLDRLEIGGLQSATLNELTLKPGMLPRNADAATIRNIVVDRLVEWILSRREIS
jgi:hypothetical protein